MNLSKTRSVLVLLIALTITGQSSAFGVNESGTNAEKVVLTAEERAAVDAAKTQFREKLQSRKTAIVQARAAIEKAKSEFQVAHAAAKTPVEKKAARQALKNAIDAAKSNIPVKPLRPSHP